MTDILQRLGAWCPHEDECPRVLIDEAAEEIERLRAELAAANKHIEELEKTAFYIPRKQPCADRDRELRERLVRAIWPELLRIYEKTDTTGANWDLVRINARAQALLEADAMIAAMRKVESDGK
jgi:hypothetical protein